MASPRAAAAPLPFVALHLLEGPHSAALPKISTGLCLAFGRKRSGDSTDAELSYNAFVAEFMERRKSMKRGGYSLVGIGAYLVCAVSAFAGATLEIYEDGAIYSHIPSGRYVGFVSSETTARCDGRLVALGTEGECPDKKRLCQERREIEKSIREYDRSRFALESLETILKRVKPSMTDAVLLIESAQKIGEKRAELSARRRELKRVLQGKREAFMNKSSSMEPRFLEKECAGELQLTLPASAIELGMEQKIDISDTAKMHIERSLLLKNRSGVDIAAKSAFVYAKRSRNYIKAPRFNPWIVQPYEAPFRNLLKMRTSPRGGPMAGRAIPAPSPARAKRVAFRSYDLGTVLLPSDGESHKVLVEEERVEGRCEERGYPYASHKLYRVCSFTPTKPVESDKWIVTKGNRVVSEAAFGFYEGKSYSLFVDIDDSVDIKRRRIAPAEREEGIFGSYIQRRDGYIVEIVNRSDEKKRMKLTQRIPHPVKDGIEVSLQKVEGARKLSLDEEGKLLLYCEVPPRSSKKIYVRFLLRYKKDMKVVY